MTRIIRTAATMAIANCSDFIHNGRKILGAGLNYKALAKELNKPIPVEPIIFMKPSTSFCAEGQPIIIPRGFTVNEEIELGVIIGRKGRHINEKEALDYVAGYCAALDMTATNRMEIARSKGLPWEIGKGFDTACPVSKFIAKENIPNPHNIQLWCTINGEAKQDGNTNDLIFSIPQLISYVSQFFTLEPNDLILTGSPPGMGPVRDKDIVECGIKNIVTMKFKVQAE